MRDHSPGEAGRAVAVPSVRKQVGEEAKGCVWSPVLRDSELLYKDLACSCVISLSDG